MNFQVFGKSSEDTAVVPCCDKVVPRVRSFVIVLISLYTSTLFSFTNKPAFAHTKCEECACAETKSRRSEASAHVQCWQQCHHSAVTSVSYCIISKGPGGALHRGGHLKNYLNNYAKSNIKK
ncbi:unnamed protein product [Ixodes pacificus]